MIHKITDREQLEELLHNAKRNKENRYYWVRARLTPDVIEKWKQEGYFRHIRTQLTGLNVDGIKFACSQDKEACEYFFGLPTEPLKNQVYHMLNALWTFKKQEQLETCSTVLKGVYHDRNLL
jgi:hypothetical protein